MNLFVKITWAICWIFFICWVTYISITIGADVVLPMKYKLPLVLSFFGPPLLWLIHGMYVDSKRKLKDTIEDKFDINR